jgi:kynurenine formamidase
MLFRTSWNSLWKDYTQALEQREKDNAELNSGEPGVRPEVCDCLATRKIAMIGSDTWG